MPDFSSLPLSVLRKPQFSCGRKKTVKKFAWGKCYLEENKPDSCFFRSAGEIVLQALCRSENGFNSLVYGIHTFLIFFFFFDESHT